MSAQRDDLTALLARVEKAEGADREIDCLIHEWQNPGRVTPAMRGMYYGDPTGKYFSLPDARGTQEVMTRAAEVSASLDAALALCERVLPGFGWEVRRNPDRRRPVAIIYAPDDPKASILDGWPPRYESLGATPALALLAAMLRALIAQAASPT